MLRELNGSKIRNGSQLQVAVSQTAPGSDIKLGILRDGKPETLTLKVGEYKGEKQVAENEGDGSQQRGKLGLARRRSDLGHAAAAEYPVAGEGRGGAERAAGKPGGRCGTAPGDVIQEVNRKPVQNAQEFAERCACSSGRQGHPAAGVVARRRELPRGASQRRANRTASKQRRCKQDYGRRISSKCGGPFCFWMICGWDSAKREECGHRTNRCGSQRTASSAVLQDGCGDVIERDSTLCTPSSLMASLGMPKTTELASSCAML